MLLTLQFLVLIGLLVYGMIGGAFLILCFFDNLITFGQWELRIKHHNFRLKYHVIVLWFLVTGTTGYQVLEKFNLLT